MIHSRFGRALAGGFVVLGLTVGCPFAARAQVVSNPAPADTASSPAAMSGRLIDELPVDSVTGALLLEPGTGTGANGALSVRGGRGGATATFLDGIPVTPGTRRVHLLPATNSIHEATLLSGPLGAALGNGTAGAIMLRTRSATGATLSYETDGPLGASSLGLSRIEGSVGLHAGRRLSLFAGGALNGQKSAEPGFGARAAPIFVHAGLDTAVTAGTSSFDVYNYAAFRGSCDAFAASTNPGIADNYGRPCHGDRTPLSATSNHQVLLKAEYGAGASTIGLIALRNRDQSRLFDYLTSYLPSNAFGHSTTSDMLAVTLAHRLRRNGVVHASLSRQHDQLLNGPLSPAGEVATRDPSLGLMLGGLDFQYDFNSFPINQELIDNYRSNAPGSRRSPYDLENTAQYAPVSRYRSNAYGVTGFAESGGPVGQLTLFRERRTIAAGEAEWQVSSNGRFRLGGDITHYDIDNYTHPLAGNVPSDVYIVSPSALGLYAEDAFTYGTVTFTAGVRYDRLSSNAERPYSLDTVAASPTFNTYRPFPRISSYAGTFNGDSLVIFVRDQSHSAVSPRLRLAYQLSQRTELRAGYSRQAGLPDFSLLYAGMNTDLAITSLSQPFGSDVGLEKSWIAEVGGRHRMGERTSLDLALFTRHELGAVARRIVALSDPTRHGSQVDVRQYLNADTATVSGAELRLERREGALTGTLGYAYQHAHRSGTETPTADSRPHTLSGAVALRIRSTGAFAGFRYASGLPYTYCAGSIGSESIVTPDTCGSGGVVFLAARLPALKQLDLRVTQAVHVGHQSVTAFVDARNLLNWRNVLRVYATTGTTTSPLEQQETFSIDSVGFAQEARTNFLYRPDGSVDLRFAGAGTGGCAGYLTQAGQPGAPNCISLIRAEQRFGNGDGIFDLAEQRSASSAAYAAFRGEQFFTGAPRRVRVGLQIGL